MRSPRFAVRHRFDAIPDQELSAARVLMLASADANASNAEVRGRQVHLRFARGPAPDSGALYVGKRKSMNAAPCQPGPES
jgi:hypothetical protein